MTTTDKLPFPPNLPPLPEPPAGHVWEYRGTEWKSPETLYAYLCLGDDRWAVTPWKQEASGQTGHYAEAVPVSTEPDYQDPAYQKIVLDAAWEGTVCEYDCLAGDWMAAEFHELVKAHYNGRNIRIKPPEPTKKRTPLTAEDIPAVCWLRQHRADDHPILVLQVMPDAIFCKVQACQLLGTDGDVHRTYQELMDGGWEYSPDRRNFKPCYVEVEG